MARLKGSTESAHKGRPKEGVRLVNPGVESGSTVLFPDYAAFRDFTLPMRYGRQGTATHQAFIENLQALENADFVELTPSGLAACTLAILSFVEQGSHILVTDSAYDPTRCFCDKHLKKLGVETTYFDPRISGDEIKALIRPNTSLIFCESPGSLTFEVQDIPAIVAAAGDIPVAVDNTWAAGVTFKPLDHGCAISVQALTKYVGGHSDLLLGSVAARADVASRVQKTARYLGMSTSARDVELAHRGLRSLHRRLEVHEVSALTMAKWLEARPEVDRVLHPGLESHPDHKLFARDFTGATGLFAFIANWEDEETTGRFIDALSLFGLGYSWGGYESLCMPAWPSKDRTAVPWTEKKQLLRINTGLESVDDLLEDLDKAFSKLRD